MPLLPARFEWLEERQLLSGVPVAIRDAYQANALQPLAMDDSHGVLANDLYQGEGTLIAEVVDPPEQGQLTLDATGA